MLPRPLRSTLFPYTTLFRFIARKASCLTSWELRQNPSIASFERLGPKECARISIMRSYSVGSAVRTEHRVSGRPAPRSTEFFRSEEHTSELQSQSNLVCRLL